MQSIKGKSDFTANEKKICNNTKNANENANENANKNASEKRKI